VAKRKKKRRGRSTLVLIAIALLIAGFIIRRTLVPQVLHYLAYRPAENSSPHREENAPPVGNGSSTAAAQPSIVSAAMPSARKTPVAPNEHLTESDRQQLEDVLKHKHR
jgi:hypothetical protein